MNRAQLREWSAVSKLGPSARLVFRVLNDYAGPDGRAWPSVATVMRDTGLSERTVRYTLRELVKAGDVTAQARKGASTVYELSTTPAMVAPGSSYRGATDRAKGCNQPRKGGQRLPPKVIERDKKEGAAAPPSTNGGGAHPVGPVLTDQRGTFLPGTGWIK